jgi:putative tricarboxylic transport membrane protein
MNLERGTISTRTMEVSVALLIMGLGALVMYDNWRIGARWGEYGPQAGYFPFYIGVLMFAASAILFLQAVFSKKLREQFAEPSQLKSILALLVPTIIYVGIVYAIGIYIGSALYLAYFMRMLGRYKWKIIAPVAIGVPAALFLLFEVWFLVPLPKGPIEDFFGY